MEEALRYLETQHGWIGNYEQWRDQGYPVGSGLVERAVAVVMNARMKSAACDGSEPTLLLSSLYAFNTLTLIGRLLLRSRFLVEP
ncbi:MAG: hypothetical protein J2P37_10790 [Ktedonobacteraceae bacterium]|nr:hypothetical protein [Ktedonobacteraceae bacterium]